MVMMVIFRLGFGTNMKYVVILIFMLFVFEGMGQVIFHHDVYDARKQDGWSAFQKYAIPPDSEEIKDDSFDRFKSVYIIKEYRVKSTKEVLEEYYDNKLKPEGWKKEITEKGIVYNRGDLRIKIYIKIPKVTVRVLYTGEDKDI